jgi:hypothetical protein
MYFRLLVLILLLTGQLQAQLSGGKSWFIDTLETKEVHTCYYYQSLYPHIIQSSLSDSIRKKINHIIYKTAFTIPAIMNGQDYKQFRNCPEGDYNHKEAAFEGHVLNDVCDWCQSEFDSYLIYIDANRYLSVHYEVLYTAGGNWGHLGYNSFNYDLRNKCVVTIPSSPVVKNILIAELVNHFNVTPILDQNSLPYPVVDEILKCDISDLTFYFKENNLRLVFSNEESGVWHQNIDIPLPKLQRYLKM